MGKYRYYCCPAGLIKQEELPEGWGLMYVNEKGKVSHKYYPYVSYDADYPHRTKMYEHPHNVQAENAIMYSALRRLHLRGRIEEIYDNPFADKNSIAVLERIVATMPNSNSLF